MITKRFLILVAAVVLAVVLAAVLVNRRAPEAEGSLAGGPVLKGLDDKINDVDTLRLVQAGGRTLLTLRRDAEGWTVAERDGYRADAGKVRTALLNLANTRVIEAKTSNAERYPQLGVEDVEAEDAKGIRVELSGPGVEHAIIIGNSAQSTGTYVRLAGQAQSLLAAGHLMPDREVGAWLDKSIVDIPSSRIRQIELRRDNGAAWRVYKENSGDANFKVADVPRGREVQSDYVANGLGSMLSGLSLEDVRKDSGDARGEAVLHQVRYDLFDGVSIHVEGWKPENDEDAPAGAAWIRVRASLDEDAARARVAAEVEREQAEAEAAEAAQAGEGDQADGAATDKADGEGAATRPEIDLEQRTRDKLEELRKEVADINARTEGWLFRIPGWRFANIDKSLEDMLKPRD